MFGDCVGIKQEILDDLNNHEQSVDDMTIKEEPLQEETSDTEERTVKRIKIEPGMTISTEDSLQCHNADDQDPLADYSDDSHGESDPLSDYNDYAHRGTLGNFEEDILGVNNFSSIKQLYNNMGISDDETSEESEAESLDVIVKQSPSTNASNGSTNPYIEKCSTSESDEDGEGCENYEKENQPLIDENCEKENQSQKDVNYEKENQPQKDEKYEKENQPQTEESKCTCSKVLVGSDSSIVTRSSSKVSCQCGKRESLPIYQCKVCSKSYTKYNIKRHMKTHSNGIIKNEPTEDVQTVKNEPDVDLGTVKSEPGEHLGQPIKTGIIGRRKSGKWNCHTGVYQCNQCFTNFTLPADFWLHKRGCQKPDSQGKKKLPTYSCHCGKDFSSKMHLERHEHFQHDVQGLDHSFRYSCSSCDGKFQNMKDLSSHIKYCSLNSCRCLYCGFEVTGRQHFTDHTRECMRKHQVISETYIKTEGTDDEDCLTCTQCGGVFGDDESLQEHLNVCEESSRENSDMVTPLSLFEDIHFAQSTLGHVNLPYQT